MLRYMDQGPSDRVSNHLQWRMPHNVASFSKLATMRIMPIIVLGFIIIFFSCCFFAKSHCENTA